MTLLLLAVLSWAAPEHEGPVLCLSAAEHRARIIEPLIELRRCQEERDVETRAAERLLMVAGQQEASARACRQSLAEVKDERDRARRARPKWGAGGAGGALILVVLIVLL